MKEGRKPEYPKETPGYELQKESHLKECHKFTHGLWIMYDSVDEGMSVCERDWQVRGGGEWMNEGDCAWPVCAYVYVRVCVCERESERERERERERESVCVCCILK